MVTRRRTRREAMTDDIRPERTAQNQLCCCPPVAYVWIDTASTSTYVENRIDVTKHLQVTRRLDAHANADAKPLLEARATTNASIQPPGGPSVNADSMGATRSQDDTNSDSGTEFSDLLTRDTEIHKDQGKVYRIDSYTVHWQAEGQGPLHISLKVGGVLAYAADWLPATGNVRLSKTYLLEPPAYDPGGVAELNALLTIRDCCNQAVSQGNSVPRP